MNLTKPELKERLGFTTDTQVAEFFGTSKQAVHAWGDDKPLPQGRQWQAQALRPDVFGAPVRKRGKQVA
jgi:hypothetical protein